MNAQEFTVDIHGKKYLTVAGRVQLAHEGGLKSITTEVIIHEPYILVKATAVTDKGTFTGMSAANPAKAIEKMSPYEVAETSAVGRALGFAGFGIVDGIATADEMVKADAVARPFPDDEGQHASTGKCPKCGAPMKISKTGTQYCSKLCWKTNSYTDTQVETA